MPIILPLSVRGKTNSGLSRVDQLAQGLLEIIDPAFPCPENARMDGEVMAQLGKAAYSNVLRDDDFGLGDKISHDRTVKRPLAFREWVANRQTGHEFECR